MKLAGLKSVIRKKKKTYIKSTPQMEGYWDILKSEKYYLNKYSTFEELKNDIDEYIYFYNYERLQKRLNSLSPMEYRALAV